MTAATSMTAGSAADAADGKRADLPTAASGQASADVPVTASGLDYAAPPKDAATSDGHTLGPLAAALAARLPTARSAQGSAAAGAAAGAAAPSAQPAQPAPAASSRDGSALTGVRAGCLAALPAGAALIPVLVDEGLWHGSPARLVVYRDAGDPLRGAAYVVRPDCDAQSVGILSYAAVTFP